MGKYQPTAHPAVKCVACEKMFSPRKPNKNLKYCSNVCKNRYLDGRDKLQLRKCQTCKRTFLPDRVDVYFCGPDCRPSRYKRCYPKVNLPRGTSGAITELYVCAKLMEEGWMVFRNMSPNGVIDLVAIKGDLTRKIEVRSGTIQRTGRKNWTKTRDRVCPSETEIAVYYPSTGELEFFKQENL